MTLIHDGCLGQTVVWRVAGLWPRESDVSWMMIVCDIVVHVIKVCRDRKCCDMRTAFAVKGPTRPSDNWATVKTVTILFPTESCSHAHAMNTYYTKQMVEGKMKRRRQILILTRPLVSWTGQYMCFISFSCSVLSFVLIGLPLALLATESRPPSLIAIADWQTFYG